MELLIMRKGTFLSHTSIEVLPTISKTKFSSFLYVKEKDLATGLMYFLQEALSLSPPSMSIELVLESHLFKC